MRPGRIDTLSRSLARRPRHGTPKAQHRPAPNPHAGWEYENLARALATPIPRRAAIGRLGLISGALFAASAWRPSRAQAACEGNTPKTCDNGTGSQVCTDADGPCCHTPKCAQACRGYQACTGQSCSDTSKLCGYKGAGYEAKNLTKFCSVPATANNYCTDYQDVQIAKGWCCREGQECGPDFGDCLCPADRKCGFTACCLKNDLGKNLECYSPGAFSVNLCVDPCPDGLEHCGPTARCCDLAAGFECGSIGCVCKGPNGATPNGKFICCAPGEIVTRSGCAAPPATSDSFRRILGGFTEFGGPSGASRGGNHRRRLFRTAPAVPAGVDGALLVLTAVDAQLGAAGAAFVDRKIDRNYKRKVAATKVSLPKLTAGPGLDAGSAASLQALLAAEAKGFALTAAAATCRARARGAGSKRDMTAMRSQGLAAAAFAGQAAKALKGLPALRAGAVMAFSSGGAAEVTVTPAQLLAFQASVESSGLPADLRAQLVSLGLTSADIKRVQAGVLRVPGDKTGPVLIAPLADEARTAALKQLASGLAAFAKTAKKQPIRQVKGGPKTTKFGVRVRK